MGQLGSIVMVWFSSLDEFGMGTRMIVPIGVSGGGGGLHALFAPFAPH